MNLISKQALFLKQFRYPDIYDTIYESNPIYRTTLAQILREQLKHTLPKSIMDFGCGTGTLLSYLEKHKFKYWGVDLSEDMANFCRQKLKKPNQIIMADVTCLDIRNLPQNIGFVTCTYGTQQYIKSLKSVTNLFKTAYRILVRNGIFILHSWDYRKMASKNLPRVSIQGKFFLSHTWSIKKPPSDLSCRIVVETHDGDILYDERHYQYRCDPYLMEDLLYKVGFSKVKLRDAEIDRNYSLESPADRAEINAIK